MKYTKSLFDNQDGYKCFASDLKERHKDCGKSGVINRHEIFYGRAYRDKSIKYGLWVNLCYACHEKVHCGKDHSLDEKLKQLGQAKFEETHTRNEFMSLFGKNRLE